MRGLIAIVCYFFDEPKRKKKRVAKPATLFLKFAPKGQVRIGGTRTS